MNFNQCTDYCKLVSKHDLTQSEIGEGISVCKTGQPSMKRHKMRLNMQRNSTKCYELLLMWFEMTSNSCVMEMGYKMFVKLLWNGRTMVIKWMWIAATPAKSGCEISGRKRCLCRSFGSHHVTKVD